MIIFSRLRIFLILLLLFSRPYYETRANYNGILKQQKVRIEDLEERVSSAKSAYNEALKRLEEISEEIHRMRKEREGGGQSVEMSPSNTTTTSISGGGGGGDSMDDVIKRLNNSGIDSQDEYRDFPQKLSLKASPVRQKQVGVLDCPHMYQDFAPPGKSSMTNEEIEQWTDIRLSHSESSSSGYSNVPKNGNENEEEEGRSPVDDSTASSSSSECNRKVTCTTVFNAEGGGGGGNSEKKEGLSAWLSKSGSLKASGRRQSLDLLIDASDRVKDVFTNISFSKVGKSKLERRSSESEIPKTEEKNSGSDFFSFR